MALLTRAASCDSTVNSNSLIKALVSLKRKEEKSEGGDHGGGFCAFEEVKKEQEGAIDSCRILSDRRRGVRRRNAGGACTAADAGDSGCKHACFTTAASISAERRDRSHSDAQGLCTAAGDGDLGCRAGADVCVSIAAARIGNDQRCTSKASTAGAGAVIKERHRSCRVGVDAVAGAAVARASLAVVRSTERKSAGFVDNDHEAAAPMNGSAGAAMGKMKRKKKFVGVRQRPSGRWVAEIKDTTHKIRMWLGTFDTAEDAARAYDEAACLLRGTNTRTNFLPLRSASPSSSPLASRLAHMLRARQNQDTPSTAGSVRPSPSPSSAPLAAAPQVDCCNPLFLSSSHTDPLTFSPISDNRKLNQAMEDTNPGANRYPNCTHPKAESQNPHYQANQSHSHSLHNPCRKMYRERQQSADPMVSQGYALQLLNTHIEAQSSCNIFQSWSAGSSKPSHGPLWVPSKSESESSDSHPSPIHTDYSMNPINRRHHEDFRILSRSKAGFINISTGHENSAVTDSAAPGFFGSNVSGEQCAQMIDSTSHVEGMEYWDAHKKIFARDKHLTTNAEEMNDLTHDGGHASKAHNYIHNYSKGGFMDALMGINDEDPSGEHSMACGPYYNDQSNISPFAFNEESNSLGSSIMQVDEFPLISELSGKLEEAERGGLHHDYVIHEEEHGSSRGSRSSSSNIMATDNNISGNAKLGLGFHISGLNSELEMKRMRYFERRASASLYALNGVHEVLMRQSDPIITNPGDNTFNLAGNSTAAATSYFNFLSISPSYNIQSSPWKPSSSSSSPSSSSSTTTCAVNNDRSSLNANIINGSVINTPSLIPSSSSMFNCPSDTSASNNSTLTSSNKGSDTTTGSDAQSQQEAAMWNSWDLAPLCTLVA